MPLALCKCKDGEYNLKSYVFFFLSFFLLPIAGADVKGIFASSARPIEVHVFYKDENHFKFEFVPQGAARAESYLLASDGKTYLVSSRGGQKLAVDFSDRLRTEAECADSINFSSQRKTETVAGLEGDVFTISVKNEQLREPMVLSNNELAGKVTKAYFLALSTLSNDGKPKPPNFIDPLVLYACIQASGYSAVLSENTKSKLRKVEEVELPKEFYSLPFVENDIGAP